MASERGFSLIETLVAMAIAAILVGAGSQPLITTSERSRTLYYQSELMHQMETLKRVYRRVREFPDQLESPHDYRLTLQSCGVDCRILRLTPECPHLCVYWELSHDGSLYAGQEGCWPVSAVRRLTGDASSSET